MHHIYKNCQMKNLEWGKDLELDTEEIFVVTLNSMPSSWVTSIIL